MTKKTRYELYALAALLVVLGLSARYELRSQSVRITGVHADDGAFRPLNEPDPSLRLDLLARIQKEQYNGRHRNIFSEAPLPPSPAQVAAKKATIQPPPQPVAPPPLSVPANFYGVVTDPATGKKRACFSANSDEIYIVPVGGTLLNQFRVMKIGPNSVELQEISSGRSTTLVLANTSSVPPNPQQAQR